MVRVDCQNADGGGSWVGQFLFVPTVPQGHKHRITTLGKSREALLNPGEPRRTLEGTSAEASENPSERQISSESLAAGCAPRMVTFRNFRNRSGFRSGGTSRAGPKGYPQKGYP